MSTLYIVPGTKEEIVRFFFLFPKFDPENYVEVLNLDGMTAEDAFYKALRIHQGVTDVSFCTSHEEAVAVVQSVLKRHKEKTTHVVQ